MMRTQIAAVSGYHPNAAYNPAETLHKDVKTGKLLCAALVIGLGGLSAFLPMTGAVIAPGEIAVQSAVKEIAHPTGGVISEILIKDGDHVAKGQTLLRLDRNVAQANTDFTGENVDQLLAKAARLTAQRDNLSAISFPAELLNRAEDPEIATLLDVERKSFHLHRHAQQSAIAQLQQRITQTRADIASAQSKAHSFSKQASLIGDELQATRKLYQDRYTTLDRLNALERSAYALNADASSARDSSISSAARVHELQLQIHSIEADARSSAANELLEVRAKISELRRIYVSASDDLNRRTLVAPQSGTIHKLSYRTIGGVVPAGQTILALVPDNDEMIIDASVAPNDIDQIHQGQPAVIRFSALSSKTMPDLNGKVTFVDADKTEDRQVYSTYYRVKIVLDRKSIQSLRSLSLRSGMPAEVFIQTNQRTMLSYILRPLYEQLSRSFKEG